MPLTCVLTVDSLVPSWRPTCLLGSLCTTRCTISASRCESTACPLTSLTNARVDLMTALRPFATDSGSPRVHIDGPDTLFVDDATSADIVVRSVQEIVTNAVRHANAQNLWITIAGSGRGIELQARDDGRGAAALVCGNGLAGMRERFAESSGSLEFTTAAGRGFEVRGFLPRLEAAP